MNKTDFESAADKTVEALECVVDGQTFLVFLKALLADWRVAKSSEEEAPADPYTTMYGWENLDIESFFEAVIAGSEDHKLGFPEGTFSNNNPWRQAAEALLLGKLYE